MSTRATKSRKKVYRSTFTYFLPAPPHRKTGYREVEFDKIMQGILSNGFEIESIQIQTTGSDPGGLFILAQLKTSNKKSHEMDLNLDIQDKFKLAHVHSSPDIILDEE